MIAKNSKENMLHDQPANANEGAEQQDYANAQTGLGKNGAQAMAGNYPGKGAGYSHAQVGEASNPQSTASASGGNTYVQTQSAGGQQTGYAVASAAASPSQQTYAHVQSASSSGRPSSAFAHNKPSSDGKSSQSAAHAETTSPQRVADAQTYPVSDDPEPHSKAKTREGAEVSDSPKSRLQGMTLEENVINNSPEYKATSSDYFVQAENSDESSDLDEALYDETPSIRFSNTNEYKPSSKYERHEEKLLEPVLAHQLEQGSSGFSKEDREDREMEIKDMEIQNSEDSKVQMLLNKFDPDVEDPADVFASDKSVISSRLPDKGVQNAAVSTEGCDQSCQRECRDAINSYRRNHKARPLILDQDLAMHAQAWADSKTYGHSPWAHRGMGGELIAVGSFYKTFTAAVKAWHDEEKDFDWEKGEPKKGKEIKHFKQLISKDAHVLGCGKSSVNGEPYYIAQIDAVENNDQEKRLNMEKPIKPDLGWYMDSSPYWKDLQARGSIPNEVHRTLM